MDALIRNRHQAVDAVETYSPAEQQFNRRRKTVGMVAGPLVFVGLLALPLASLPGPAHRLAAILGLVVVLWITEALPLAVTALLGPVLAILLQVAPAPRALASFADPIIFLFIGSFILAESMYVHGLDRRIAYTALSSRLIGRSAGRLLVAFGAVSVVISMWISNTATAAMMFPIGMSIVTHLSRQTTGQTPQFRRFATTMMLITAFGASLGGMATPIGTPPNLIGIGMIRELLGLQISFFRWMALGLPLAVGLYMVLALGFWLAGARGLRLPEGTADLVRRELALLGRMSRGERNVMAAFFTTVLMWTLPGLLTLVGQRSSGFALAYEASMPEAAAALTGAILLFVLPVDWRTRRFTMSWAEAVRIDWGTVLLFGGGLAMGSLAFSTGLAEAMGRSVATWVPSHTSLAFTVIFTGFAVLLSEMTSNTASASMVVPVAIAVCQAAGVRGIEPALGATLGASVGFMLPISTPPNAIAYSSGHVPIGAMMKHGVALDVVSFVVIVIVVSIMGPLLF
jgi:solute carrier family 13 (sodium-dependent dicarboxylate transporter), member 2/3/5